MPPFVYTSAEVFDFESQKIIGSMWTCFAPTEKLRQAGSLVVGKVGNVPILVTRGLDGKLRGFINACRHRGYPVALSDLRECKKLTCQYHAWTYALDGRLVAVPEGGAEVDRSELSLLPISVETWGQFVFVNCDPNANALHVEISSLANVAERFGMDLDPNAYEIVEETTIEHKANWKLWFDNNCECYHCPSIHGNSFASAFQASADAYTYEPHGLLSVTAIEPTSSYAHENAVTTLHIFPGCHIVQQKDLMVMARAIPLAANRYQVSTYYLGKIGADTEIIAQWIQLWKQTYERSQSSRAAANQSRERSDRTLSLCKIGKHNPCTMSRMFYGPICKWVNTRHRALSKCFPAPHAIVCIAFLIGKISIWHDVLTKA